MNTDFQDEHGFSVTKQQISVSDARWARLQNAFCRSLRQAAGNQLQIYGAMMNILGADHTSYTVSNLEQSIAFYVDHLGFTVLDVRPEIKNHYFRAIIGWPDAVLKGATLAIPGTTHQLELFEYIHPRGVPADVRTNNPGSAHVSYFVDDLNAFYTTLSLKGVRFRLPPVALDEGPNQGGFALYMLDPDGITIELF